METAPRERDCDYTFSLGRFADCLFCRYAGDGDFKDSGGDSFIGESSLERYQLDIDGDDMHG